MKYLLILIFIPISYMGFAQSQYAEEIRNQDFKGLLSKAEANFKSNPKDSIAEFYMGVAYSKLGEPKKGIEHLIKVRDKGLTYFPVNLNLAKNYVALNDLEKALATLSESAELGIGAYQRLEDAEFASLQENEDFKAIKKKMYTNAFPCKAADDYRRFDFWVGEWDVYVNGAMMAKSSITLTKGECGILENYQPMGGFGGGTSISYFDSSDGKWKQDWVASGGVSHYIEPDSIDYEGQMQLIAKSPAQWYKMTWFKNDDKSVRQLMEMSTDKGTTWTSIFDGRYVQHKEHED